MSLVAAVRELIDLLASRKRTLALAESCTGGLVSSLITSIPGASEVFKGGLVAYSNEIKQRMLGVPEDILLDHGSVSGECAEAMARGALACFRTDYALSITGIAGPGGGLPDKPVGTVWYGLSSNAGTSTVLSIFNGSRDEIRTAAARKGLELITSLIKSSFELDNPLDRGVSWVKA